jgi:hypothetical protein
LKPRLNNSLNKCFIEFSSGISGTKDNDIYYALADALDGSTYAEIEWTVPNQDLPLWCDIYPEGSAQKSNHKICKSKDEFDRFVEPFMNE